MTVDPEIEARIRRAVNFIIENPSETLSLERLAAIANYSPFHFQRLFKVVTGETPKQFILRIRLETAAHEMVMFLHRPITTIAYDHGFSSSATFSRAFRNYFGISPYELKKIPHEERYKMYRQGKLGRHILETDRYFARQAEQRTDQVISNVRIVRRDGFRAIYLAAPLDDEEAITTAFRKVGHLADSYDLLNEQRQFVGLLYPHQNLYHALAIVSPGQEVPAKLDIKEIRSGRFAVLSVTGGVRNTFAALRDFTNDWIPKSGYRIGEIFGFETLVPVPPTVAYAETIREVYVRVEPAF